MVRYGIIMEHSGITSAIKHKSEIQSRKGFKQALIHSYKTFPESETEQFTQSNIFKNPT